MMNFMKVFDILFYLRTLRFEPYRHRQNNMCKMADNYLHGGLDCTHDLHNISDLN